MFAFVNPRTAYFSSAAVCVGLVMLAAAAMPVLIELARNKRRSMIVLGESLDGTLEAVNYSRPDQP
jgi:hypothetical protein